MRVTIHPTAPNRGCCFIVNNEPRIKRVAVLVDEPSWIHWSFFPHKVLQKRYQSLLIEHLKERIPQRTPLRYP
uniref:Transposase n=1 Tax=Candidatus Kentrum sp. LPFa TaxID=2126335 RepID=A0A450WPG2_9GAMM|nr:MAG: hypothetical protein BECKLPF1236B_GA0070989_11556 [Candidatus Kentron sp. LPFa]